MFLDTFAWIEYFEGTKKGVEVRSRFEAAELTFTSPMVLAEIVTKTLKTHDITMAERRTSFVQDHCAIVDHTAEIGIAAGRIHHEMKGLVPGFGMADAFILAAARSRGARVLTGDPHFKGLPDADLL